MERQVIPLEAPVKGEDPALAVAGADRWPVDTAGGRFYAEWEYQTPVTRDSQLMFFLPVFQSRAR